MSDQYPDEIPRRRSTLERFLGGSPLGVIVRLLLLSLVVGFVMNMLGLRPQDVIEGTVELFRSFLRDGMGMFRDLGFYIVTGAVLVVPIWFLVRLSKSRR